jgi:hypothetical protein
MRCWIGAAFKGHQGCWAGEQPSSRAARELPVDWTEITDGVGEHFAESEGTPTSAIPRPPMATFKSWQPSGMLVRNSSVTSDKTISMDSGRCKNVLNFSMGSRAAALRSSNFQICRCRWSRTPLNWEGRPCWLVFPAYLLKCSQRTVGTWKFTRSLNPCSRL